VPSRVNRRWLSKRLLTVWGYPQFIWLKHGQFFGQFLWDFYKPVDWRG
jgi:hypothetical protein